jgi:hypothetical protein
MEKKTEFVIIDKYLSKTDEERKNRVLNIIINYINTKIKAEDTMNDYQTRTNINR